MVPVNNVAAITTPDSRTIAIKPWDKSMFAPIEKAIIDSNVGIMPENNGEVIRLGIPPLTEERRRDLTKQCNQEGEDSKIAIRNVRRDGIDKLKKSTKTVCLKTWQKMQKLICKKLHDKMIKRIEELLTNKAKEIMTV